MKKLLISLINIYQAWFSLDHGLLAFLAPGGACKYPISCSEYAKIKIREFGVVQGGWMSIQRIWGCR